MALQQIGGCSVGHPGSGLEWTENGSDESTTRVLQISSTDTPALHASHFASMALQQYSGSGNAMDLAEAVEAITARRSIKADAINPVNFMMCLYLLCFDEVLLLLLLICVCVHFTCLLLVFVSCVGRRGADDSDANVSEGSSYILPSRSTKAKMSMRHR